MLNLKDIKQGDTFWECESGFNDEYIASEDAKHNGSGWGVKARFVESGIEMDFFEADRYRGMLKLYSSPQYA
jgi:hypothetical protein